MKTTKKEREERKQKALEELRDLLPVGAKVYCIVGTVARSGMSRRIQCFVPVSYEEKLGIRRISYLVANALGYPLSEDGVRVDGCGMDMGFALVSDLSRALHYDNYALDRVWM